MFEHSSGGWHVEQRELSKPGKVRVKIDDAITLWCERAEDGTWILNSADYARRREGKRPVVFQILRGADLQLGRPGFPDPVYEALRNYWDAWRKSEGGVLERLAALEESEKAINAEVERAAG